MRGAIVAQRNAGMVTEQANGQIGIGAICANMFTAEQPKKGGKGGNIGNHAGGGQARRYAHHILFGNA